MTVTIIYRSVLASIVGLWIATQSAADAASAGSQGSYVFAQGNAHTISRMMSVSAVRIFSNRDDAASNNDMRGAGFVVDAPSGLVVTAHHVVGSLDSVVWLTINGRDRPVPARILHPDSNRPATVPDFVLLKIDPPQEGLQDVEIQLSPIEADDHWVTGFGNSSLPEPQRGDAGGLDRKCTFTVRATTLQGDSGSAVISQEGLVDGVAVQGGQSQGNGTQGLTNALPLHCVRDKLLAEVPDDQTPKIIADFLNGDSYTIRSEFQPPRGQVWFTNLRVAKALESWIVSNKGKPPIVLSQDRSDDLLNMVLGRRLGIDLARQVARLGPGGNDNSGNLLQKSGDALNNAHAPGLAIAAYRLAVDEYSLRALDYRTKTAERLSEQPEGGSYKVHKFIDAPVKDFSIAKLYKGAADSMTKISQIAAEARGGVPDQEKLDLAASFAAASVFYAPPGDLKANAWAALGTAAQRAGKPEIAVPAYKEAIGSGADYKWTVRSFTDAKAQLGGAAATKLDAEFLKDQAVQARIITEAR